MPRYAWLLFGVLVAVPPAAAHPLPDTVLMDLSAHLSPSAPLEYAGVVQVPYHLGYALDWRPSLHDANLGRPVLEAERLDVQVEEVRWRSLEPDTPVDQGLREAPRMRALALHAADVQVHPGPEKPHFFVHTAVNATSDADLAMGGASCKAEASDKSTGLPPADDPVPAWRDPWLVASRCTAGAVEAAGDAMRALATGVRLEVAGLDPDGQETRHEIVTGSFTTATGMVPLVYEHVVRTARFLGQGASFSLSSLTDVELFAPYVAVIGPLHVPASIGTLSWGERTVYDPPPTVIEGYFVLTPPDGSMDVAGHTHEGPRFATPMVPAALDGALPPAATLAGLFGIGALVWLRRGPLLAFFTRLVEATILGHDRRRAILECIEANPAVHVKGVAERLELPRGVVRYHVHVLTANGLVEQRRFGTRNVLFARGNRLEASQERLALFGGPLYRGILDQIAADACVRQREIADRLGVTQSYVSRALQLLQTQGIVKVWPQGRRRRYEVCFELRWNAPTPGLPAASRA